MQAAHSPELRSLTSLQAFVTLLQTSGVPSLVPQAAVSSAVHSTHAPALPHIALPGTWEHSLLSLQGTQVCVSVSHCDAAGSVQSACFKQGTHVFVATSQNALGAAQSGWLVHSTHVLSDIRHAGVGFLGGAVPDVPPAPPASSPLGAPAVPSVARAQSLRDRHCTQLFVAALQTGV
jgi:hypothetical protein